MTLEQRRAKFELLLRAAMEETGFTVSADIMVERLGPVVQSRAIVTFTPDPSWQDEIDIDKKA